MGLGGESGHLRRTFGINDFAALLCRCTIAACLYRTIGMIHPEINSEAEGEECGTSTALRWAQLQRRVLVSLLVNHRFWGRESRNVLHSLKQTATVLGGDLSPEQWLSLFQRVRAQGMASTLPTGDEADDPDFLRKRAEHTNLPIPGSPGGDG